jgi:hypothetical protein
MACPSQTVTRNIINRLYRYYFHLFPVSGEAAETYDTVNFREKGIVCAFSDVSARVYDRSALPYDDTAGPYFLSAEPLDSEHLGIAVSAVRTAAAAFFMCHGIRTPYRHALIETISSLVYCCRCPFLRR